LIPAVAAANLLLGAAYLALGTIVLLELRSQWRAPGVWRFGAALAAMALTCGPHHVTHGMHVGFEHHPAGRLDLVTVLVGLPPALVFLWLRLEALTGRRGDRWIAGSPGWLQALPVATGAYVAAVVTAGFAMMATAPSLSAQGALGLATGTVFVTVAWLLLRTQLRNRHDMGGWSLSGLALAGLFTTCAVMHVAVAMEMAARVQQLDVHLMLVDGAAVAAAGWFVSVVRALTREARTNWEAVGSAPSAPA
jgi:hypothetical protein